MNRPGLELIFFVLMAAGALGAAVVSPSMTGYLGVLFLIPVGALLFAARAAHEKGLYCVCSGVIPVIACGALSIWAGLFTAWMLAGVVLSVWGMLEGNDDFRMYLLFCCATFFIACAVQLSNHVLLPLLVFAAGAGLVLFVQVIRDYQFRKEYSGVGP